MFDIFNHISVLVLFIAFWSILEFSDGDKAPFFGVGAVAGTIIFVIVELFIWPIWYLFFR